MQVLKNINSNKALEFLDGCITYSFCALIFFLPISIALVDTWAAFVIFFYLAKKIYSYPKIHISSNLLKTPLILLVLITFCSVLLSKYFGHSLFAFFGKFLKVVILFLAFNEVMILQKRKNLFLIFLMLSLSAVLLSGYYQHFTGIDFIRGQKINILDQRITSSFKNGNSFGPYLIIVIGILLAKTYQTRKTYWGVFLVLAICCLIWTFSRASWVGFIAMIFFLMILDKRKFIFLMITLLLFLCFALPALKDVRHVTLLRDDLVTLRISEFNGFNNLFQVLQKSKEMMIDLFNSGGSGRRTYWKEAISIIKEKPILGHGINTYTLELKEHHFSMWYAHNSFLQMASEIGIVGLIVFLWMVILLFIKGCKSYIELSKDNEGVIIYGCLGGLIGFLVASFFDNTLYSVQLTILFWVILGYLSVHIKLTQSS